MLSIVLCKSYMFQAAARPGASPSSSVVEGTNIRARLPGVDWAANGETVLLALSTHCHYCTESAPFFKRLTAQAGRGAEVIAVLAEPPAEAERYLADQGVHVDAIRQLSLGVLGVAGTPTMMLVNGDGKVKKVWTGKVQPPDEDAVLALLRPSKPL
jgi:peroxiredoxin